MNREPPDESPLAFGAMMAPQPLAPVLIGPWKVREVPPGPARQLNLVVLRAGRKLRRAALALGRGLLCQVGLLEFEQPMSAPLREERAR